MLDERFKNDDSDAPAYSPSVLLKVILYAYSRGMIRSRDIAQACQDNTRELVAAQANLRIPDHRDRDFRTNVTDDSV